jgi:hypothetical protein
LPARHEARTAAAVCFTAAFEDALELAGTETVQHAAPTFPDESVAFVTMR